MVVVFILLLLLLYLLFLVLLALHLLVFAIDQFGLVNLAVYRLVVLLVALTRSLVQWLVLILELAVEMVLPALMSLVSLQIALKPVKLCLVERFYREFVCVSTLVPTIIGPELAFVCNIVFDDSIHLRYNFFVLHVHFDPTLLVSYAESFKSTQCRTFCYSAFVRHNILWWML